MDRNVSPKVLWIVGAVIAGVVVAIAIIGYRDGQLMEQDRQAEKGSSTSGRRAEC